MYLYTRRTKLTSFDGVDWANRVKDRVAEVSGNPCELWATMYGEGYGTMSWTSWYPDLTALQASGDALIVDAGYLALAAEGSNFTAGGVDDQLLKPVVGDVDPERPITYVTGVTATCAAGNIERAMGMGVEISQAAESATGLPTMFLTAVTGPYGGVGWLTGYENIAAMEKAQDDLAAAPAFLKLVDSSEGCFAEAPELTVQTIYRKIG